MSNLFSDDRSVEFALTPLEAKFDPADPEYGDWVETEVRIRGQGLHVEGREGCVRVAELRRFLGDLDRLLAAEAGRVDLATLDGLVEFGAAFVSTDLVEITASYTPKNFGSSIVGGRRARGSDLAEFREASRVVFRCPLSALRGFWRSLARETERIH